MHNVPVKKPENFLPADESHVEGANKGIVRVNLNVPYETRNEWKHFAIDVNRSMTDIIIEAMQEYLDAHRVK